MIPQKKEEDLPLKRKVLFLVRLEGIGCADINCL